VEEIGQTQNSSLELETKITQMEERTNNLDMNKVEADLKEIKQENTKLLQRLKET
jgi:hypothetical protein